MSRRLAQMTEETLEEAGSSARKAVDEAGFDEKLRLQLEERIAGTNFKNEYASAIAQAALPASVGKGTRDIVGAKPWTGTEAVEDTALRMLTDTYKPLRGSSARSSAPPPPRLDGSRSSKKASSGVRLANARDRSSIYSVLKSSASTMSEQEREKYHAELKARFQPEARAVPATIQGLASLANERIEDAIARGQFKNLPRGGRIERDHNASSPFIDTTEYLMNKMIQKQAIVPPWIEKQQELVAAAARFRGRLRNDWKRHAARSIASRGGTLADQVGRAEAYAAAEEVVNTRKRRIKESRPVTTDEHLSQISLSGELTPRNTGLPSSTSPGESLDMIPGLSSIFEENTGSKSTNTVTPRSDCVAPSDNASPATFAPANTSSDDVTTEQSPINTPSVAFRDPTWESTERSYHTLAITNLNALTRSYNLMAPDLAKKPYFSLDRELRACYADVAPQLAGAIRDRAASPSRHLDPRSDHQAASGVMAKLAGPSARVFDEKRPRYGLREFWRDLFAKDTKA